MSDPTSTPAPSTPEPARILLDTDIGTDVDDALALGVLLGSPEVRLLGCTTVYGDTVLRARLTRRLAGLAGHDVPVVAGAAATLTEREVFWPGHEGRAHEGLADERLREDVDAVGLLTATVAAAPGAVDVVAIGPLTNIAHAVRADPAFAANVRRLYVMGGRFDRPEPEHNFQSDPEAARIVFASGVRAVVCGLEATQRLRIAGRDIARITAAGGFGAALGDEIAAWCGFTGEDWSVPHDPLTVLTLVRPDLFGFRRGAVDVSVAGADPGTSVLRPDPDGPVEVAADFDAGAATEEIVARIIAAGAGG
ncbi:purine nucleosidase [Murinocardiopsis flavida]|uniref:Purine nucleosidase n=1 Tax=Murinocardiopsis flavida TaxID=645275 RepID=A0A2P8DFM9_9ACTN|nr:nucleoside hydrolase [Murinocardiopsis flavida]PSK96009.1 purine nucleosidase [Murinocardiopsis flavida]